MLIGKREWKYSEYQKFKKNLKLVREEVRKRLGGKADLKPVANNRRQNIHIEPAFWGKYVNIYANLYVRTFGETYKLVYDGYELNLIKYTWHSYTRRICLNLSGMITAKFGVQTGRSIL